MLGLGDRPAEDGVGDLRPRLVLEEPVEAVRTACVLVSFASAATSFASASVCGSLIFIAMVERYQKRCKASMPCEKCHDDRARSPRSSPCRVTHSDPPDTQRGQQLRR